MYDIEGQIVPETPKLMSALPIKWPQEVVVRVYVIRVSRHFFIMNNTYEYFVIRDLISQREISEER